MPRAKAPHGTYPAYRRHLREKSPVCGEWRAAQVAFDQKRSTSSPNRALRASADAPVEQIAAIPVTEEGHVSKLEMLREMLTTSREVVAHLRRSDPARVYLQMREQREIVREIAEIQGNGQVKGVTLADQLAEARAKRAANS